MREDPIGLQTFKAEIALCGKVVEFALQKNDIREAAGDALCFIGTVAVENNDSCAPR